MQSYNFIGNINGLNDTAITTIDNLNLKILKDYRKAKLLGIFYEVDGKTPIIFHPNDKTQLLNFYQNIFLNYWNIYQFFLIIHL